MTGLRERLERTLGDAYRNLRMDPEMQWLTYQTSPPLHRSRMPDLTSAPSRIPGYNLAAPTEATALASLERVFGVDRGRELWAAACSSAGLVMGFVHSPDTLQRATAALSAQGGPSAAVARSITIRMRTYANLLARSGATTTGAVR